MAYRTALHRRPGLIALAVLAGAVWLGSARAASAPAGNLLVEWRLVSASQARALQAGTTLSTTDIRDQQQAVQRLWVLNGGRAKLYVGRSVPLTTWQIIAASPTGTSGGNNSSAAPVSAAASSGASANTGSAQLLSQTTWIDLGQGLSVHPHWPGGHAPVVVEIEAQSRSPVDLSSAPNGFSPDGQTQRHDVSTTLAVPLGQWVVVAQGRAQQQQQVRGSWSTSDLDSQDSDQLEIRVSAP